MLASILPLRLAIPRSRLPSLLDSALFRRPFAGAGARRYATRERSGFGDFDERLLTRFAERFASARRVLDVGAGDGTFARAVHRRFPHLEVLALEPSAHLARLAAADPPGGAAASTAAASGDPVPGGAAAARPIAVIRALAEDLPIADRTITIAVCLSSIRHVADRARAFAELRRVLVPGGALILAELDPDASAARIAHHARGIDGRLLRLGFATVVVPTAPARTAIIDLALAAGFEVISQADDPWQPLYLLELR